MLIRRMGLAQGGKLRFTKEQEAWLHILGQLAKAGEGAIVNRKQIAAATGISEGFLQVPIKTLERAGIIYVHRGTKGGLELAWERWRTVKGVMEACCGGPVIEVTPGDSKIDKMLKCTSDRVAEYLAGWEISDLAE